MATPIGYGTLLECPYNKAHRVQATGMARHLFKCRKMYPDVPFVTCPFNYAHKIAEPELKMHTATCEDRANFDMYKYCITTGAATHNATDSREPELIYNTEDPIAPNKVQDDDEECWDDLRIPAYNPQEYCATAKIIRKATLKTPAEKREFYEQEMIRHRQLEAIKQEEEDSKDGSSSGRRISRSRSKSPFTRYRSSYRARSRSLSSSRRSVTKRSRSRSRQRHSRSNSRSSSKRNVKNSRHHRSRSRSNRRSLSSSRSRRSRSNSRKSRSVSLTRGSRHLSSRSPSLSNERRYQRSPSPSYSRQTFKPYVRPERYESYPRYNRYDSAPTNPREGHSNLVRYPQFDYADRYNKPRLIGARRDSRDRDDEEYIYRRDFRD